MSVIAAWRERLRALVFRARDARVRPFCSSMKSTAACGLAFGSSGTCAS